MEFMETIFDYALFAIMCAVDMCTIPLLILLVYCPIKYFRTDAENTELRKKFKRYILLSSIGVIICALGIILLLVVPEIGDDYQEVPRLDVNHSTDKAPELIYSLADDRSIAIFSYKEDSVTVGFFETIIEDGKPLYLYSYETEICIGSSLLLEDGWWSEDQSTRYYFSDWQNANEGVWIALIPEGLTITPDSKRTIDYTGTITHMDRTWTVYIAVD